MPEPQPAMQFVDLRQQHDVAQLGMWVFLATEVLFFGGLILAYCVYRYGHPAGFAEAARHTKIVIGTANTAMLLTSSFLVAWAVTAARAGVGAACRRFCCGAAALLGRRCSWRSKASSIGWNTTSICCPGSNSSLSARMRTAAYLFFSFYFVATGLHALHVAIGIVALVVIGLRAYQRRLFGSLPRADHGRGLVLAFRRCGLDSSVCADLSAGKGDMTNWQPPRVLLLSWLILLALLGLTVLAAYRTARRIQHRSRARYRTD